MDLARRRLSPERISTMPRVAEVLRDQSIPVAEVFRKLGIPEQPYYRWRKAYGGMRVDTRPANSRNTNGHLERKLSKTLRISS